MQQQVIIVGGGMVGLSLSLMLAKANIAVKLLEAVKYPNYDDQNVAPYHSSFDARNTALSRRSVQIYQKLGLWDALQQHAKTDTLDDLQLTNLAKYQQWVVDYTAITSE